VNLRCGLLGVLGLLGVAFLWGCDENPVSPEQIGPQAIVGRVISTEVNVEVAAWQAQLVRSTVADDSGYFALESMPVGVYEIRIATPSGKTLNIQGVTVAADQTTSLKEIRLDSPSWPFSSVYPRNGAVGVSPLVPSIQILSTQALDLQSLIKATTFAPSLEGTWYLSTRYAPFPSTSYSYQFTPTSPLEVARTYVWSIGPGLTIAGGQVWGDSLTTVFTTEPLRLLNVGPRAYSSSGDNLITPNRSFTLYVNFNALVDPDSLTTASVFTPALAGVWVADPYYTREAALKFFYTGDSGLRAEQTYEIKIDGSTPLVGSSSLGQDLTVSFTTDAVKVIESYPRQGEVSACAGCAVQVAFNSEMDSVSLASAFTFETFLGSSVAGTFFWSTTQFAFKPDSVLAPGAIYVARLDTTAHSLWGDHLKQPFALYFRVRE